MEVIQQAAAGSGRRQETVIRLHLLEHDGKERMFLEFPFNRQVSELIKEIPGARWSQRKKMWHLNPTNQVYLLLKEKVKGRATLDSSGLKKQTGLLKKMSSAALNTHRSTPNTPHPTPFKGFKPMPTEEQRKAIEWFRKWMLSCGYSPNTIETYGSLLALFFLFTGNKPVREVTEHDVIEFNAQHIIGAKKSGSYQRQAVNAIKLFYAQVNNRRMRIEKLERVKRGRMLPGVLSLDEIKTLIAAYGNPKHKALIALTYSCGLRRSEALNLKWRDIDRKRMLLTVRLGKGAKDRQVVLPSKIIRLLEAYYQWCKVKPKIHVFEGQYGGQYTGESFIKVLRWGLAKAAIRKKATLHTLRHSYATHLHEQGTDIAVIQQLLGHHNIKTTLIYTHISKKTLHGVKNPIEQMEI